MNSALWVLAGVAVCVLPYAAHLALVIRRDLARQRERAKAMGELGFVRLTVLAGEVWIDLDPDKPHLPTEEEFMRSQYEALVGRFWTAWHRAVVMDEDSRRWYPRLIRWDQGAINKRGAAMWEGREVTQHQFDDPVVAVIFANLADWRPS
jgi:hypothetical protein